jgi:hypothetical protein
MLHPADGLGSHSREPTSHPETVERARPSNAPLTAAVRQRDVAKEAAGAQGWEEAALVGRTVTINRPRAKLYAFWRDLRNPAAFMENVESVTVGWWSGTRARP